MNHKLTSVAKYLAMVAAGRTALVCALGLTVHGQDLSGRMRSQNPNETRATRASSLPPPALTGQSRDEPLTGAPATAYSRMTYTQAQARIPPRKLPEFWIGNVNGLGERLQRFKTAKCKVIARSPGGRPLHLASFGAPENPASRANFNSAIGGKDPTAYRDKASRHKPVVLFIGPVHGQEVEGLTGLVNLMQIMETGRDLRGKDQSELQALGRRCQLLIVPAGNPDGIARFEPRTLQGLADIDLLFWGQGTWRDDTFCGWPECKRQHPMTGKNVGFLGCYFNDRGINPMHDEFFDPMSSEAPAILRVAKEAAPDLVVSLHSHENKPAVLRTSYVPADTDQSVRELARRFYSMMDQRRLPHAQLFSLEPESGRFPSSFNLASALYHVSGAQAFTFECPHGLTDASACPVSLEQILDIQLILYEAMLRFELDKKAGLN